MKAQSYKSSMTTVAKSSKFPNHTGFYTEAESMVSFSTNSEMD